MDDERCLSDRFRFVVSSCIIIRVVRIWHAEFIKELLLKGSGYLAYRAHIQVNNMLSRICVTCLLADTVSSRAKASG